MMRQILADLVVTKEQNSEFLQICTQATGNHDKGDTASKESTKKLCLKIVYFVYMRNTKFDIIWPASPLLDDSRSPRSNLKHRVVTRM